MQDRVEAAVANLGYEPNLLAQSLRSGANNPIGFVVGDISNPLVSEITLGAEVSLQRAGYTMLLANSMNDAQLDASYIQLFAQRRVDGLLLSVSDESFQPTVDAIAQHELPCVLVDRELATDVRISAVVTDHDTGMSAAIGHLVELGHRHIALVNGNPRILPARAQTAAVRRSARRSRAGCVVRSGTFTAAHGEDATESLLRSESPPTAIIAGSNQILIGVLRSLRRWEFAMPADISLVTCDRVDLSEFTDPPLATIERDLDETGKARCHTPSRARRRSDGGSRVGPDEVPACDELRSTARAPPARIARSLAGKRWVDVLSISEMTAHAVGGSRAARGRS